MLFLLVNIFPAKFGHILKQFVSGIRYECGLLYDGEASTGTNLQASIEPSSFICGIQDSFQSFKIASPD
jgi:hypothetical protein